MTVNRAQKTLTVTGIFVDKDTYVNQAAPTTNYGFSPTMDIGGKQSGPDLDKCDVFLDANLPEPPADADTDQANEGIVAIDLQLYLDSKTAGSTTPHDIRGRFYHRAAADWTEGELTWNLRAANYSGGIILDFSIDLTATGVHKSFLLTGILNLGFRWGNVVKLVLEDQRAQAAHFSTFRSRDQSVGNSAMLPKFVVTYFQKPPAQITDLAVAPLASDPTQARLTWTASKDALFSKYQVYKKEGGGAWAQVGADLTDQGTVEFVVASVTGGVVTRYLVRELNTDGSWNESNVVWVIRNGAPGIILDDVTPTVNQKVTATLTPSADATPPSPVPITDYYVEWGSGAEEDTSTAWFAGAGGVETRTHVFPYAGTQTPQARVKNALGFWSVKSGAAGYTVASVAPVAKIRAAPLVQATGANVTFFGDESYAPAANKLLAAANAYEWDQDYTGAFAADFTTTEPKQAMTWGSAGTKTVALRVKDVDAVYSPVVTMTVEVVAVVTVNLDNLVDKFDVLDHDRGRQGLVYETVDAFESGQAAIRPTRAKIGGFAFTDAGANGIPDDIETLVDIVTNKKKVQLTLLGVVRTGILDGGFATHEEGGWNAKMNWTASLVLD